MKKLFFTALVAVVAVGGAYAQTGEFFSPDSQVKDIFCEAGISDCTASGYEIGYNGPNNTLGSVQLDEYQYDL